MRNYPFKVNHSLYESQNINQYTSYLLGFIWGDGYLYKKRNKIDVSIIKKDFLSIENIIDNTGNWTKYEKQPLGHRQSIKGIVSSNPFLFNLLCDLNYDKKSYFSLQKAIEYIPKQFQHFWLRGYFDADGCIYYNQKNYCCQSTFCSTYEQDWDYLSNLLKQNNIHNTVIRRIQKSSKHSVIRIVGKPNNENLFKLLYPNKMYDIGLLRKFEKFNSINYIKQKPWAYIKSSKL